MRSADVARHSPSVPEISGFNALLVMRSADSRRSCDHNHPLTVSMPCWSCGLQTSVALDEALCFNQKVSMPCWSCGLQTAPNSRRQPDPDELDCVSMPCWSCGLQTWL